jgi:sulfur-carrier protein
MEEKGAGDDMQVKVFANLRVICGGVSVEVVPDGNRAMDVLDKMIEMFPELKDEIYTEDKKLKPFVHLYVNGRNIVHAQDLDTLVSDNDQLALFPPVAGG